MPDNIVRFFVFAFILTLASCSQYFKKDEKGATDVQLQTVTIEDQYSLDVPAYMTSTTALNDDASLQYQNIFKEAYVIVIDEDKEEFVTAFTEAGSYDTTRTLISNYADTQVQLTTSAMNVISKTEVTTFKINGLNAAAIEIDATVEGVISPITYFLTFVEGGDQLYMIMAWTLQDRKDNYRSTFGKMATTFKTLDGTVAEN